MEHVFGKLFGRSVSVLKWIKETTTQYECMHVRLHKPFQQPTQALLTIDQILQRNASAELILLAQLT